MAKHVDLHLLHWTTLKIHQDIGNRAMNLIDHVKMFWTTKCVSIKRIVTKSSFTGSLKKAQSRVVKGSTLKRKRISKRFTKKVKDFVCQRFKGRENTGHKNTLVQASKKIGAAKTRMGIEFFRQKNGWVPSKSKDSFADVHKRWF